MIKASNRIKYFILFVFFIFFLFFLIYYNDKNISKFDFVFIDQYKVIYLIRH
jgi:hypothetical protein